MAVSCGHQMCRTWLPRTGQQHARELPCSLPCSMWFCGHHHLSPLSVVKARERRRLLRRCSERRALDACPTDWRYWRVVCAHAGIALLGRLALTVAQNLGIAAERIHDCGRDEFDTR